jgi:hypothetical protein
MSDTSTTNQKALASLTVLVSWKISYERNPRVLYNKYIIIIDKNKDRDSSLGNHGRKHLSELYGKVSFVIIYYYILPSLHHVDITP